MAEVIEWANGNGHTVKMTPTEARILAVVLEGQIESEDNVIEFELENK